MVNGKKIYKGSWKTKDCDTKLYYNLDGKYSKFYFTIGHKDAGHTATAEVSIYVDGVYMKTFTLSHFATAKETAVNVQGNSQVIVEVMGYMGDYIVYGEHADELVPSNKAHQYKDEVITEAAFAKEGTVRHVCTVCGTVYFSTTPALTRSLKDDRVYVQLDKDEYVTNGKARRPKVKVTYSSDELVEGKDYTLVYKDNIGVGTATVEITGMGYYTDATSASFYIKPAKMAAPKLKKKGRTLTISWKKVKNVSGYEISCLTYKSSSHYSTKTVSAKKNSVKITKLYKKQKYYVYIRAYKKMKNGNKYYGPWSKVKSIKM